MKASIIDGKVVTKEKKRNPRARVLDTRFQARIAAIRDEFMAIKDAHQAEMDKQHSELTEKIEAAILTLMTLAKDIAKKIDEIVSLEAIIADHQRSVDRIESVRLIHDRMIKETGVVTIKRHPGLMADLFDRAIDIFDGKVKNQPPDLTAGEFNRGE